jgi:hypothetical protein
LNPMTALARRLQSPAFPSESTIAKALTEVLKNSAFRPYHRLLGTNPLCRKNGHPVHMTVSAAHGS